MLTDHAKKNGNLIYAIEVKAEENLKEKSLRMMKDEFPEAFALRTSMSDFKTQDGSVNIPLYSAGRMLDLTQSQEENIKVQ